MPLRNTAQVEIQQVKSPFAMFHLMDLCLPCSSVERIEVVSRCGEAKALAELGAGAEALNGEVSMAALAKGCYVRTAPELW